MNEGQTNRASLPQSVIGLIRRESRFLVIRRSQFVVAPGQICFPGGMLEEGENESDGLQRELREELGVTATPIRRVWRSVAPWQVELNWWLTSIDDNASLTLSPAEIESSWWATVEDLLGEADLLESNHQFLLALSSGEFTLDGGAI